MRRMHNVSIQSHRTTKESAWNRHPSPVTRHSPLTLGISSAKLVRKPPSNSSALSIFSAYSPRIQINDALASGSSRSSKLAQRVGMMPSYR